MSPTDQSTLSPNHDMPLVIIESPYAGDIERNIRYARACVKDSLMRGEAPIASHLLYTQPDILKDDIADERQLGIKAGLAWRQAAQISAVYTDYGITEGMRMGIEAAETAGITIDYRTLKTRDHSKEQIIPDKTRLYLDNYPKPMFHREWGPAVATLLSEFIECARTYDNRMPPRLSKEEERRFAVIQIQVRMLMNQSDPVVRRILEEMMHIFQWFIMSNENSSYLDIVESTCYIESLMAHYFYPDRNPLPKPI